MGYVGLPLAVEFAKKYTVISFDINKVRIDELNDGIDNTLEIEKTHLKSVLNDELDFNKGLFVTDNNEFLKINIEKYF